MLNTIEKRRFVFLVLEHRQNRKGAPVFTKIFVNNKNDAVKIQNDNA